MCNMCSMKFSLCSLNYFGTCHGLLDFVDSSSQVLIDEVALMILVLVALIICDVDTIVVPIVQDKMTSWLLLQW